MKAGALLFGTTMTCLLAEAQAWGSAGRDVSSTTERLEVRERERGPRVWPRQNLRPLSEAGLAFDLTPRHKTDRERRL